MQTIKSVARRRWPEGQGQDASTWYEPLSDPGAVRTATHWALGRPDIFVNTPSDLGLLRLVLDAARSFEAAPPEPELRELAEREGVEALFVRGFGAPAA